MWSSEASAEAQRFPLVFKETCFVNACWPRPRALGCSQSTQIQGQRWPQRLQSEHLLKVVSIHSAACSIEPWDPPLGSPKCCWGERSRLAPGWETYCFSKRGGCAGSCKKDACSSPYRNIQPHSGVSSDDSQFRGHVLTCSARYPKHRSNFCVAADNRKLFICARRECGCYLSVLSECI